jgi:hypothetical protein
MSTEEQANLEVIRHYFETMSSSPAGSELGAFYTADACRRILRTEFLPNGAKRDLKGFRGSRARPWCNGGTVVHDCECHRSATRWPVEGHGGGRWPRTLGPSRPARRCERASACSWKCGTAKSPRNGTRLLRAMVSRGASGYQEQCVEAESRGFSWGRSSISGARDADAKSSFGKAVSDASGRERRERNARMKVRRNKRICADRPAPSSGSGRTEWSRGSRSSVVPAVRLVGTWCAAELPETASLTAA